jgi:uncharacterized membrane protein YhhN
LLGFVVAVVIAGALAVVGAERNVRWLEVVFKPLATILLLGVVGRPETTFGRLVAAGLVLSIIGDTALLWSSRQAFLVGLAAFLLAHLAYVVAFVTVSAGPSLPVVLVALAVAVATRSTVRAIWAGSAEVRGPALAYAAVISLMVVCAAATMGGPLRMAPFAAVGAALFYLSDSSLARNLFAKPIPHVALLTLGVYWLGQLGIAIAAHAGT